MKLGLKGTVLLGVMAASLLGGVGSALALTRTGASAAGTPGAFDGAAYLYWGHEQTSLVIAPVEDLSNNEPQYRGLTVSPQTTKSLAGNVQLTFTLSATAGHHIKGLTVSVYQIAEEFNALTAEAQIGERVASPVLDDEHLTGTTNLAVSTSATAHETVGYYAIKVLWDGSNDGENPSYTLDGKLTVSQTFVVGA